MNGTNWNPGHYAYILNEYLKRKDTWRDSIKEWLAKEDINLERGYEYATYIFNAVFGDNTMFKFNGNVMNHGIIENLPYDCCVEVPILASRNSLEPIHIGAMPDQLATLINTTARCEVMAVDAALERNPRKVFHAVAFDPLTSAVLSLDQIKEMVDEMMEKNKEYLGYLYK